MKDLETSVVRVRGGVKAAARDWLAVERPLQIRARAADAVHVVSTTMRTPGDDVALAAGFLFGERVIQDARQLLSIEAVDDDAVMVELAPEAEAALEAARRPFVTTGACGVCGRASVEELLGVSCEGRDLLRPKIPASLVQELPLALRAAQATFARTGGLHAAGLFAPDGTLLAVREDVGRHNAVDKLIGGLMLEGRMPGPESILVVSGRASFELVQKAAVAAIPVMVAVGAPSSLAVEIADAAGMTLLGFVRDDGFNVYTGMARVEGMSDADADVVAEA
jgi:FdhD protein